MLQDKYSNWHFLNCDLVEYLFETNKRLITPNLIFYTQQRGEGKC